MPATGESLSPPNSGKLNLQGAANSLAAAAALPDVTDHWAEKEIRQLVDMVAITGYPDDTYKPENTISRAELSSVLRGALGLEETATSNFLRWKLSTV